MPFCKEMKYDSQLGGYLKVVITRVLYLIDYILPHLNCLTAFPQGALNILRIMYVYTIAS
jgi:hypothetical protein